MTSLALGQLLPQYQWCKPELYEYYWLEPNYKKHNKAGTMFIIIVIYCRHCLYGKALAMGVNSQTIMPTIVNLFVQVNHDMRSSHGNSFHITDYLWGEYTGDQWIPLTSGQKMGGTVMFSLWLGKISCWTNNQCAGNLRHCNTVISCW